MGKYSSGKTTFVSRLIADLSGSTASGPETGCVVIHKQEVSSGLVIFFNAEMHIESSELFIGLLNEYGWRNKFTRQDNKWISRERELVLNWDEEKIINFIKKANDFPEIFYKIIWNHRKKKDRRNTTLLDFVDLYDMPGFDGKSEHDLVVEAAFRNIEDKPDVILYLIDTDKGIPSDNELKSLERMLGYITEYDPKPLFYWVYEKPENYTVTIDSISKEMEDNEKEELENTNEEGTEKKNKTLLEDGKESMENLIIKLKNGGGNIGEPFKQKYINYLSDSVILDAGEDEGDTELAQNAVSLVLQDYFSLHGMQYLKTARKLLAGDVSLPKDKIMNFVPRDLSYETENPFIKEILENIKKPTTNQTGHDVKKIFYDGIFPP